MKLSKLLVLTISSISLVVAGNLIETAKESGLKPIPSSQSELLKLIDNSKNPITKNKIELGKKLYFDPRLSKSGLISCNTCHNLALGGDDGIPSATGHKWTSNPHHLNSPTVYNSVFFSSQFWDGRSPHLEDQAQGPIQADPEMAAPKKLVVQRVTSIPEYIESFKEAYGDEKITFEKIADTIATFERILITPSKFDKFLEGDKNALNKNEKEGLKTFIDKGCATCHNDIALGGTMQPFPVVGKYKYSNVGDFKGDANSMVKVPTLRNITETAPYFHNGTVWSLAEVVKIMGETQLGVKISNIDTNKIITFLKTLEGEKPKITYPVLPKSTDKTPKPDMN